ncbi:MAG TPA: hypothetical protein VGL92_06370, partial [Acidimicrobiia bacterium]
MNHAPVSVVGSVVTLFGLVLIPGGETPAPEATAVETSTTTTTTAVESGCISFEMTTGVSTPCTPEQVECMRLAFLDPTRKSCYPAEESDTTPTAP